MSTALTVFKFLAMWTLISIWVGLGFGTIIRWGLHYEPPEPQPMHPMPSGSMRDEARL
jgi:hypothetical protein